MGRPSDYTEELGLEICERIANGESLRGICRDEAMPDARSVFRWLARDDKFCQQYAHAREAQADALADDLLEISDDGTNDYYKDAKGNVLVDQDNIARSRLRVDTRKWIASKLKPKKYGERVEQHHSGEVTLSQLIKQSIDAPPQ